MKGGKWSEEMSSSLFSYPHTGYQSIPGAQFIYCSGESWFFFIALQNPSLPVFPENQNNLLQKVHREPAHSLSY